MRVLRTIFSKFYLYVLWAFFAFLICGQIFSRLGDAPAAHKVTLYADVPSMRDAALAAELERELPEGIRAVKVHPFSYAMIDDGDLLASDLYIIPESHVEQYADSLRPIGGAAWKSRSRWRTASGARSARRWRSSTASSRAWSMRRTRSAAS